MRTAVLRLVLAVGMLLGAPVGVAAAPATPLELTDCGPAEGVFQCSGLVQTWDGVPLDTTVTLPSERGRNLPLVVELHGFGNSKHEYLDPASTAYTDNAFAWARDGYAVLTFTARGLWGSCGTPESRAASPAACAEGYLHLADVRYEVRDAQELIGRLVDQGYAAAGRIGVTGDSYGGGQTLMLAALRDRVMLPDGRLIPWRSPAGRPLRIAAAAPVIPWADLVTAAAPNGRVSPTGVTSGATAHSPIGVAKGSFVNGIGIAAQNAIGPGQPVGEPFVPGRPMGFLAPPGVGPRGRHPAVGGAHRRGGAVHRPRRRRDRPCRSRLSLGVLHRPEPSAAPAVHRLGVHRRPVPGRRGPPIREPDAPDVSARTSVAVPRRLRPSTLREQARRADGAPGAHPRMVRPVPARRGVAAPRGHRVRGDVPGDGAGPRPLHGSHFRPAGSRRARVRAGDHPTADRFIDRRRSPGRPGDRSGDGGVCAETPAEAAEGAARYVLKEEGAAAWTLLGAPRIEADLTVQGAPAEHAQIVARLWDVAPGGGSQRLVARGTYRPSDGPNAWWLHPAAWRFAKDHAAVLELVGADAPYARPSNAAFMIEVHTLQVTLPAR